MEREKDEGEEKEGGKGGRRGREEGSSPLLGNLGLSPLASLTIACLVELLLLLRLPGARQATALTAWRKYFLRGTMEDWRGSKGGEEDGGEGEKDGKGEDEDEGVGIQREKGRGE